MVGILLLIVVLALLALLVLFLARPDRLVSVKVKVLQLLGLPRRPPGQGFNGDYETMSEAEAAFGIGPKGGESAGGAKGFENPTYESSRAFESAAFELQERQPARAGLNSS